MEARECPGCECLYAPRHAREADRCWSCAGVSFAEHLAAIKGEDPPAPANGQPGANGSRPEYLRKIDALLGS